MIKQLVDAVTTEISISPRKVAWRNVVKVIWLLNKRKMMCCVLAFSGDYGKAIRETTEDILATRNSKDFGWMVEIYKGSRDALGERERI